MNLWTAKPVRLKYKLKKSLSKQKNALDELTRQRVSYLAFLPFVYIPKDRKNLLNEIRKLAKNIIDEKLRNHKPTGTKTGDAS